MVSFRLDADEPDIDKTNEPVCVLKSGGSGQDNVYKLNIRYGSGERQLLGDLRIYRHGEDRGEIYSSPLPGAEFDKLSNMYCSLGQSYDYYERIGRLSHELRKSVLSGLNDIVMESEAKARFRNSAGWYNLLPQEDDFISLSRAVLTGDFEKLPKSEQNISLGIPDLDILIKFKRRGFFSILGEIDGALKVDDLSSRIAVIVKRNRTGEDDILNRLALIAYAPRIFRDRPEILNLAKIQPSGYGFTRVVTISFSAFSSFRVPGIDQQERLQNARDIKRGEGRFIFYGIRDLPAEFDTEVPNLVQSLTGPARLSITKTSGQFQEDYRIALNRVKCLNRKDLLDEVYRSFQHSIEHDGDCFPSPAWVDTRRNFSNLGIGLQISLAIMTCIVAHIEDQSIVLIDEPAMHLSQQQTIALIRALKTVMKEKNALLILHTSSPLVLLQAVEERWIVI